MTQTIEIFRAGQHTAMSGERIGFSEADLAATAGAYDPKLHEAPVVVGHPRHDAPAYGWVKGLRRDGGSLRARLGQVEPAFAEAVQAGRYKKVSASFYKPDSPSNPKPGVYYLRHVGFLGAQPPAVKGLAPIELGEAGDEAVTVELAEVAGWKLGDLFRSLRNWLIEQFGAEAADTALPEHLVTGIQEDAAAEAPTPTGFAEGTALGNRLRKLRDEKGVTNAELGAAMGIDESTVGQILSGEIKRPPDERLEGAAKLLGVSASSLKDLLPAEDFAETQPRESAVTEATGDRESEIARREAELRRREAEFAERARQQRRQEREAQLDALVQDGRPLPCDKARLMAFMDSLDGQDAVQFAEGETRDPNKFFLEEVLGKLPKQVDYAERTPPDDSEAVTDDATQLAREAVAYQEAQRKAGVEITVSQAVAEISKRKGKETAQ